MRHHMNIINFPNIHKCNHAWCICTGADEEDSSENSKPFTADKDKETDTPGDLPFYSGKPQGTVAVFNSNKFYIF